MAKSKSEYWLTDEGLLLIESWARAGLVEEQIAKNMGVSRTSLSNWKNQYPEILEALKKGKSVVDFEIENALFEKALSGDIRAIIFWLKNRKPKEWRDKQEATIKTSINIDERSKLIREWLSADESSE